MRVSRVEREIVLQNQRRQPDVVRWDGRALLAQLTVDRRVVMRRLVVGEKHTDTVLEEEPPEAGGGGLGFGGPPAGTFVVKQDDDTLKVSRAFGKEERTITYRFDGRESVNRLPTAVDANTPFTFVSRWEGQRLVSRVTWKGPSGPRERIETLWLEGETLVLQNTRPAPTAASEPLVETHIYVRKR